MTQPPTTPSSTAHAPTGDSAYFDLEHALATRTISGAAQEIIRRHPLPARFRCASEVLHERNYWYWMLQNPFTDLAHLAATPAASSTGSPGSPLLPTGEELAALADAKTTAIRGIIAALENLWLRQTFPTTADVVEELDGAHRVWDRLDAYIVQRCIDKAQWTPTPPPPASDADAGNVACTSIPSDGMQGLALQVQEDMLESVADHKSQWPSQTPTAPPALHHQSSPPLDDDDGSDGPSGGGGGVEQKASTEPEPEPEPENPRNLRHSVISSPVEADTESAVAVAVPEPAACSVRDASPTPAPCSLTSTASNCSVQAQQPEPEDQPQSLLVLPDMTSSPIPENVATDSSSDNSAETECSPDQAGIRNLSLPWWENELADSDHESEPEPVCLVQWTSTGDTSTINYVLQC